MIQLDPTVTLVDKNGKATDNFFAWILARQKNPVLTVATLPTASTALTGTRFFVTDSNSSTFHGIVAGGGSTVVPVYCDGTNWRIG